jgi:hypothetical protein
MNFNQIASVELRQRAQHSLNRLCVENVRFDLDEGDTPAPVEPCLIAQLTDAVIPSGEVGGGGRSGSRSPASDAAIDLLASIEHEASTILAAITHHPALRSRSPQLMGTLRWMKSNLNKCDEDQVQLIGGYASKWCEEIVDFLNPRKRTPLSRACPACKYETHWTINLDLEMVKTPCLHAVWEADRVAFIECGYCGTTWGRHCLWEVLTPHESVEAVQKLLGVA